MATAHRQQEGGGFVVRRPVPSGDVQSLDPILLVDEMGPVEYGPGEAVGAPDHPHRGFETVTYILEGEGEHADSAGHAGTIAPGDVQWMTAGSGVVHREMPSKTIQRDGGRVHGFQVWVNLPREHKMVPPRYQEIPSSTIPSLSFDNGRAVVRVIAGDTLTDEGVIKTFTPVVYQHWALKPSANVNVPVHVEHNLGVYVFEGQVSVGERDVSEGQMAVLTAGDSVTFSTEVGAQLLLLGGRPLNEPVAWAGPFVMNTEAEVRQAFLDFRAGRMGRIPPEIVRA